MCKQSHKLGARYKLFKRGNLKQLKPIRFDGYILKGGSTKPWNIACVDLNTDAPEELSCVLKLFKPTHIADSNSIGKEFICNLLAAEFDLVTPEAYLVDPFDEDFKLVLDVKVRADLKAKHEGITFASRMVNATIVNPDVKSNVYSIKDCAILFAFDCLIMNQDRGGYRQKSNLMIDDDGLILIDHELTFHFLDGYQQDSYRAIMESFQQNNWVPIYLKHIFYGKLKDYRGNKGNLFDTFEEYLTKLDLGKIEEFLKELASHDITVGQNNLLIQYLCILKQNANKFSKILLNLIS